ncbi:indole-3-glycerol phosphate synthase [Bacteroidia bacterium]|nr:indole-3-glycerol phosphate synthase [Bacteroidia bacterium]
MNSYLAPIIANKRTEVDAHRQLTSIEQLEKSADFGRKCWSLKAALLRSATGIIAEFKRKSPSRGWIHEGAKVRPITAAYSRCGATGISILTDEKFFGGTLADVVSARPAVHCPILRKDFMIDEYQIFEAKSCGADVVLLIAAALPQKLCRTLAQLAHQLGLETLLEIHAEQELDYISDDIDIVGVNNRNLTTFEVSTEASLQLAAKIPAAMVKISESGIDSVPKIKELQSVGYRGFLMGEVFMKNQNPDLALSNLLSQF